MLSIAKAIALFDACSPALTQARALLDAARGDQISGGHAPNPTFAAAIGNINPQAGTGAGALRDRTVDTSLRIDQVIERGGKRDARRAQTAASSDAAQWLVGDALQRGHQSVLDAYTGLSAALSTAALLRADADSYEAGQRAMTLRLAAGDVAQADVNRTALDAARAVADADAADLAVLTARATLGNTLGVAPLAAGTELQPLDAIGAGLHAPDVPGAAAGDDSLQRPDLHAAAARLSAAQSALKLADAGRKRDVDVSVGYDHWPVSATNTQGTGNSYTIGFSVPLFVHDSGRGAQLRSRAELRAAQSDLDSRRAEAERELATTRQQALQAQSLARRYRDSLLPAADQILQAEEIAYRRGSAGLLELLDARRSQRQVAVAAIAAQRDALSALGRLALAHGSDPFPKPASPPESIP